MFYIRFNTEDTRRRAEVRPGRLVTVFVEISDDGRMEREVLIDDDNVVIERNSRHGWTDALSFDTKELASGVAPLGGEVIAPTEFDQQWQRAASCGAKK